MSEKTGLEAGRSKKNLGAQRRERAKGSYCSVCMADSVAAITGLDPAQAASYLEMAGGDVEMAVQLFFSMAEGEPAAVAAGGGGGGGGTAHAGTPAHAALFGSEAAPPPWIEQGFEFSAAPESRCGLLQGKNGPCGVLAAVNAELLAQKGCPPPSPCPFGSSRQRPFGHEFHSFL